MRKCDPGTNDRSPIKRRSPSWNKDPEFDCCGQSTGLCASSWLSVQQQDSVRRSPSLAGVEPQSGSEFPTAVAMSGNVPGPCVSASHRISGAGSSRTHADFGSTNAGQDVLSSRSVCPSGRTAPFFHMSKPFSSRCIPSMTRIVCTFTRQRDDTSRSGRCFSIRLDRFLGCLQNGQRTHSLIGMSDEKRNADERPPTRGKSNCHR